MFEGSQAPMMHGTILADGRLHMDAAWNGGKARRNE